MLSFRAPRWDANRLSFGSGLTSCGTPKKLDNLCIIRGTVVGTKAMFLVLGEYQVPDELRFTP